MGVWRESVSVKMMNIWFQDAKTMERKEHLPRNPIISAYMKAARLKSKKPLSLRGIVL